MSDIYKISDEHGTLGCVVASNKRVADAYALGRYGAGAATSRIACEDAVEAFGVCVLVESRTVAINNQRVRVLS